MFVIGEAIIEEGLIEEQFACDLAVCKGACCTLPGGRGAPLGDDELAEISRAFPSAAKYLSPEHLRTIEKHGMFDGHGGNFATICVSDKDCVFVYYEDSIARCSLEKAYLNGETEWRKPLSCHLFPMRVSPLPSHRLRYEEIPECRGGKIRGWKEHIQLTDFLKDALTRKFGEEWYRYFQTFCKNREQRVSMVK